VSVNAGTNLSSVRPAIIKAFLVKPLDLYLLLRREDTHRGISSAFPTEEARRSGSFALKMPVIEVLLFGAALAIGGPRAWEKFQTERAGSSSLFWGRDEEADKLPPTTPPGKAARPLSMPSSPRYFSLLEGTAVNWRSQGASPRVSTADVALSGPTSGSSGKGEGLEFGAMLHSALSILSPRSSRPRSPDTTDFAESPRTNGCGLFPAN